MTRCGGTPQLRCGGTPQLRCGGTPQLWRGLRPLGIGWLIGVMLICAVSAGQTADDKRPLVEREPYDLLTLERGGPIKVLPIPLPGRQVPSEPDPKARLKVRLLDDDEKQYEVLWEDIESIQLFEQLLLAEAERLTDAELFDEAFACYYRLQESYRGFSGLDDSLNRFLFLEARELIRAGRYAVALSSIEELYTRAPGYRHDGQGPRLTVFLDRLVDRIARSLVDAGEFTAARAVVDRAGVAYGATQLGSVGRWQQRLIELAVTKRNEGRRHLADGEYRAAIEKVREMMEIWPQVSGGRELDTEVAKQYPMVTVAVLESTPPRDAPVLGSWAAQRTLPLVHQPLVDFLGVGPEGGHYEFPFGQIERSDDRKGLVLHLGPEARAAGYGAYEVARHLLDLANPSAADYRVAWGSLMKAATIEHVNQVRVELRRPHVLPEAVLAAVPTPRPMVGRDDTIDESIGRARFEIDVVSDREIRLRSRSFQVGARLAEIAELKFDDSAQAIEALRAGRVDMIDRLFPADALQFREGRGADDGIHVGQYALPTVHMLVPTSENPLLADPDFRRALLFAIDRASILNRDLLGGRAVPGCRLVSGPFPIGVGVSDPLGYAYDTDIEPRPYLPALAKLLSEIARKRVADRLADRGESLPDDFILVLGHPAHEAARVSCQAIADQLQLVGVPCDLLEMSPGAGSDRSEAERSVDLWYLEIGIREPLVDADRLFGAEGLVRVTNPHVSRSLRSLSRAQNWSEVSEGLRQVHRTVHDEVAVIPLWQLVDFFAYGDRVRDVGERPLSLYQNVDQWRVADHP